MDVNLKFRGRIGISDSCADLFFRHLIVDDEGAKRRRLIPHCPTLSATVKTMQVIRIAVFLDVTRIDGLASKVRYSSLYHRDHHLYTPNDKGIAFFWTDRRTGQQHVMADFVSVIVVTWIRRMLKV
ncbi:hypothetical protein GHT06_016378 [Daphnia sinensis]|uniref:Uncharacterized protein n=1 Tax=Daphnia sinensis TaxID=1820382 RepID=A0AAD5PSY2_9CRUS|nr:hypothetical protein GHT06_016378 [Daphnia sinensis]